VTKRKALTKKIRFEVFKRDSFACQYCGRKAPDVLLQVDHIEPVAKGGTNDILNLITSCFDCNAGKSDSQLSDSTVLDKQRQQLEQLQERKKQIEMMFQWQKALLDLDDEVTEQLALFWSERVPNYSLNENGKKELRKLQKKFELSEIMDAMRIAVEHYIEYEDGQPTQESVEHSWKKVGGICRNKRLEEEDPALSRIYYIRGILRNQLSYCNEWMALDLLRSAVEWGANVESLERHAKSVRNWTQWRTEIEEFLEKQQSESEEDPDDEQS
jgi:hypothetical protein